MEREKLIKGVRFIKVVDILNMKDEDIKKHGLEREHLISVPKDEKAMEDYDHRMQKKKSRWKKWYCQQNNI